ncbi:unnamed protein product [Caenorhabditis bovis]|uniref:Fork-head domain-containing protein n=1 Tax=Caenorhabditis bovis TaxID=2654633 RepID=A0A8S1EHL8_9PELO|nr:unnamed protein product [Caenorhabditis bovis]
MDLLASTLSIASSASESIAPAEPSTPVSSQQASPVTQHLTTPVASSTSENIERPSLSYKDLIIEAIESSPEKRLKLNEIYQVIRLLHPYYRHRPDQWGWQNSIRHNLSLHDCFVKLPLKQTSASGVVGHYWTVVPELSDKQTLRRRNRAQARTSSKKSDGGRTFSHGDRASSGSGDTSPSPSDPSISPPHDLPKPLPSYIGLDLISNLSNMSVEYKALLLQAFLYQNGFLQQSLQNLSENGSSPVTTLHQALANTLLNPHLNPVLALNQIANTLPSAPVQAPSMSPIKSEPSFVLQ